MTSKSLCDKIFMDVNGKIIFIELLVRACLKIAFYKMCFTLCGRFVPNLGDVAGYIN